MNTLGLAVFLVAVAAASAGYHAGGAAVIAGPAGTVVTSGAVPGAVYPGAIGYGHGAAGVVVAPAVSTGAVIAPALAHGAIYGVPGILAPGSGLEGQYVHDHSELLYDDGSYKPHVYGH